MIHLPPHVLLRGHDVMMSSPGAESTSPLDTAAAYVTSALPLHQSSPPYPPKGPDPISAPSAPHPAALRAC